MENKGTFTRILAIAGTVLVWLTILAPFALAIAALVINRVAIFDYLIPSELFPVAVVGGLLVLWAAYRARPRLGLIGWALSTAIIALVGSQVAAALTGVSTRGSGAGGAAFALVIALIVVYSLALVAMGVDGILLIRDVFRAPPPGARKGGKKRGGSRGGKKRRRR